MIQVEEKRLAELLRKEWKLDALEGCRVENWEWYGDALFPEHGTTLADIEDFTSDEKIIKDYL